MRLKQNFGTVLENYSYTVAYSRHAHVTKNCYGAEADIWKDMLNQREDKDTSRLLSNQDIQGNKKLLLQNYDKCRFESCIKLARINKVVESYIDYMSMRNCNTSQEVITGFTG